MQKFMLKSNIEKFLNTVYDKNAVGEGCRQLWIKNSKGEFKEIFFCKSSEFAEKIDKFIVNSNCDYYITKNSFYADKRGNEYLYSLDNIVIDIDNHSSNDINHIRFQVAKLLYILADYQDVLPPYTISVISGRGVQLWWHIKSMSSKLLFIYKIVCKYFCDVLSDIISDNDIDLSVDYTASCNAAGLVRLPFTFNSAIGYYIADVEIYDYCVYDINDLISEYDISIKTKKNYNNSIHQSEQAEKDYKNLNYKRIKFLEKLVQQNNNRTGIRNNIIFLYYNALVQLYSHSESVKRSEELNNKFSNKLEDLSYIFDYIDKKGFLKFRNENFIEYIGVSEMEKNMYSHMERDEKRKLSKEERNKLIMQLAINRMTCENIAQEVGCSVRTVKTVLKNFNKSDFTAIQVKKLYAESNMTQQQIADILKISRMQVSRYLKLM